MGCVQLENYPVSEEGGTDKTIFSKTIRRGITLIHPLRLIPDCDDETDEGQDVRPTTLREYITDGLAP